MEISIKEQKNKNIWISSTGYRIFIELKAFLQVPRSIDELIEIIKNDIHFQKAISPATIRSDINTLSIAGCKFVKDNNRKYKLINHPFKPVISDEGIDALVELRNIISSELTVDEIFILNNLYDKFISLTFDENKIKYIYNSKLLPNVDIDIFKEISNPKILNKKVQIEYKSPKYGNENVDIIPLKISYENNKVYLIAYNYKYEHNSFFEVSKILKINSVSLKEEIPPKSEFNVIYEVKNNVFGTFELKPYEKIIEYGKDTIKIEAAVLNEFMFVQRLLLLNQNFKVIEPDFFRENLINKIKLIQKRYENV